MKIFAPLAASISLLALPVFAQEVPVPEPGEPESSTDAPPQRLEPFEVEGSPTQETLNQRAQLNAEALLNIVSGDKLENVNDQDVGDVLNRVPGVTLDAEDGAARGVVIRGVEPGLNKITVDGQNIGGRSGGRQSRGAGALNLIAPEFLESIEVTKAPTPDMDADAIGGTINLSTASAAELEKQSLSVRGSSQYSDAGETWSHRLNVSYGQPFETERPMGLLISFNAQEREFRNDRYGTRNNWPILSETPDSPSYFVLGAFQTSEFLRESEGYGLVLSYDWKLSDQSRFFSKLSANTAEIAFQRTRGLIEFSDNTLEALGPRTGTFSGVSVSQNSFAIERETFSGSGIVGFEHKSDLWEIDLSLGASLATDESSAQAAGAFESDAIFVGSYDYSGDPLRPVITLSSDTGARLEDPSIYNFSRISIIEEDSEDREWMAQANLRRRLDLDLGELSVKVGTKYVSRESEVDENSDRYGLAEGVTLDFADFAVPARRGYGGYVYGPELDGLALANYVEENPQQFVINEGRSTLNSLSQDYDVSERVWSVYAMGTLERGPWRLISGVRMERTETEASGFTIIESPELEIIPASAVRSYTHWLPGLHGRYMPHDNFALRSSLTQTISRPSFRDISPFRNIQEDERRIRSGNPDLQPYESDNVDLTLDFYFNRAGFFQIGAFYKEIDNFIVELSREVSFDGEPGFTEDLEVNGDVAELWGLEFVWQNEFTWLPVPFNRIKADLSYTWTASEATIPQRPDSTIRLPEQAEHTVKATVTYEWDQWELEASLDYISHRFDEIFAPDRDEFDSEELSIDLGLSYKINRNWTLTAGLSGLLDIGAFSYFGDPSRLGRTGEESWRGTIGVRWRK